MASKYKLLEGEAEIHVIDGVSYKLEPSGGLSKLLNDSPVMGSLVLTSERLLFCWEEGTFRKRQEVFAIPLNDIRVFNGSLQLKLKMPQKLGGSLLLDVFQKEQTSEFAIPLLKNGRLMH